MKDNKKKVVVGPNFLSSWFVYDFVLCNGTAELEGAIEEINRHGYDIVGATQSGETYTVIFRRRACG